MPGPFPTVQQADAIERMEAEYGTADLASIAATDGPYADVRLIWWDQRRVLHIKPDGTRQLYHHREGWGEHGADGGAGSDPLTFAPASDGGGDRLRADVGQAEVGRVAAVGHQSPTERARLVPGDAGVRDG